MRLFGYMAVVCMAASLPAQAQQNPSIWQPEVRKALPVETPTPAESPAPSATEYENPRWMERVLPAQPVNPLQSQQPQGRVTVLPTPAPRESPVEIRPAIPVAPATPASPTPEPNPTAAPSEQPETSQPPEPRAAPPDDDPNSIRLRPQAGERDEAREQLDKANSIYARKMYDFAAMEYETFLTKYPSAPGRDAAWFRLGESYRALEEGVKARAAFTKLTSEFDSGEFVGAGAYRLGELLFAEGRYDAALREFDKALKNAGSEEIRLSAKYQAGRCLDRLGRPADAIPLFEEVADVKESNPYREYARLALAGAFTAAGKKEDAFAVYEMVAKGNNPPLLRAEAGVKAGALASELDKKQEATALFQEVIDNSAAGQWRAVALLGILRLHAAAGNTKELTSIPQSQLDLLTGEYKAEAYGIIASALRDSGSSLKSLEYYNKIASEFPKSKTARNTRFNRIVVMHELSDPGARDALQEFLKDPGNTSEKERGSLLLAEIYFQEEKFAEAAPLYRSVLDSGLPAKFKEQAHFKYGWCLVRQGSNAEADLAFSEFIQNYPKSEFLIPALTQRGLARQQNKNFEGALDDFNKIIGGPSKGADRELALQQKALILGERQDYSGMKAAFLQLLEENPKSKGVAQAEYWVGWAEFEEKDFAAALPRLTRARELDPAAYSDRAGIRIALSHYYMENREALLRELNSSKPGSLPPEVYKWLGLRSAQENDFSGAERALTLAAQAGNPDPETLIVLAETRNAVGKNKEALEAANSYMENAREPAAQARGFLAVAEARRGLGEYEAATEAANEALRLQPEGRLNAAGRITLAEISFSKQDYAEAAKAFMSVALLYEDPTITPRALQRAAESYRRSNNPDEADKVNRELETRFPDFAKTQDRISRSP